MHSALYILFDIVCKSCDNIFDHRIRDNNFTRSVTSMQICSHLLIIAITIVICYPLFWLSLRLPRKKLKNKVSKPRIIREL